MLTSIKPGRSRKLLRGQHFADDAAIGTIGTPADIANREAPDL